MSWIVAAAAHDTAAAVAEDGVADAGDVAADVEGDAAAGTAAPPIHCLALHATEKLQAAATDHLIPIEFP